MKRSGPWSGERAARFLSEARIPLRLACNGESGHPVLVSLWFDWRDDKLWCATQRDARSAALLERDPRCAFEVSGETPPYFGLRGQGRARLHPELGAEVLERLVARYLDDPESDFARWLLGRSATEVAIAIEPDSMSSWDYRDRMNG